MHSPWGPISARRHRDQDEPDQELLLFPQKQMTCLKANRS